MKSDALVGRLAMMDESTDVEDVFRSAVKFFKEEASGSQLISGCWRMIWEKIKEFTVILELWSEERGSSRLAITDEII